MANLVLEIDSNFAALGPATERLHEFLGECGAPDPAMFIADLVIEELVTNAIKYGYDDDAVHRIRIGVEFADGRLSVQVRDDGRAFNPLEQAAPDTTLSADERDIGGLGIHLVRQMTDDVCYERSGEENVVTATKTFAEILP
jgi:serine/threonine-protein kinase RsbW